MSHTNVKKMSVFFFLSWKAQLGNHNQELALIVYFSFLFSTSKAGKMTNGQGYNIIVESVPVGTLSVGESVWDCVGQF